MPFTLFFAYLSDVTKPDVACQFKENTVLPCLDLRVKGPSLVCDICVTWVRVTRWGSLHIQTGLVELTAVTPPPVNHMISDLLQKV